MRPSPHLPPAPPAGGRPLRRALRTLGRRPERAGWVLAAPLAGLAALRAAGVENRAELAVAHASTHFLYLPAWAALAVGVARRRPGLATVAAAVAGAHATWTVPALRRSPPPPDAGTAPRLRLFSANIQFAATDWDLVAAQIRDCGADVVLVQELTPVALAVLHRSGAFDAYSHALVDARPRSFGGGIWSRRPLHDARSWDVAGLPMTRAAVDVGGHRVQLYNVHTRSPLLGGLRCWQAQLAALGEAVAAEADRVVLAGDFNATFGNPGFRRLLRRGLTDAHSAVGRGLAASWPCGWPVPPLFRLDHVLLSEGLAALDAGVGGCTQSDHRAVWADVAVVGRPDGAAARRGA